MESKFAVLALKALASSNRLQIYRLLVQAGDDGMTVGELQAAGGHAAATLTNHLNVLRQAGLVADRREGRNIHCSADYAQMNQLLEYLTENCCAGSDCGISPSPCKPAKKNRRTRT